MLPGLGLLPDDFPDAVPADLRPLARRRRLHARGHRDPARALLRDDGRVPGRRERPAGDAARHVRRQHGHPPARRGSTLYLPVQVEQALFSCGDAHGCQGDGEVCVTGLEAPMFASLRFTLEKGRSIPGPQYRTPAPLTPRVDTAPFYGDHRRRRRPLRRRAGRHAGDGRPHRHHATASAARTPTCSAASPST